MAPKAFPKRVAKTAAGLLKVVEHGKGLTERQSRTCHANMIAPSRCVSKRFPVAIHRGKIGRVCITSHALNVVIQDWIVPYKELKRPSVIICDSILLRYFSFHAFLSWLVASMSPYGNNISRDKSRTRVNAAWNGGAIKGDEMFWALEWRNFCCKRRYGYNLVLVFVCALFHWKLLQMFSCSHGKRVPFEIWNLRQNSLRI